MATKPNENLNFETTAVVAIPPGKQTTGFLPGERPPAQYFNWLFRTMSRMYNYVKDGAFTGNHSIDGNLSVTGSVTLGNAPADVHTVNGSTAFADPVSFANPVTMAAAATIGRLVLKTVSVNVVAADNNDLDVGDGVVVLPISPGAGAVLTGFSGGVPGRILIVFRSSASGATAVAHERTSSSAANRLTLNPGSDATLNNVEDCIVFCYQGSRWREVSRNF